MPGKTAASRRLNAAEQLTAELQNVGDVAGGDAGALDVDLIDAAAGQLRRVVR